MPSNLSISDTQATIGEERLSVMNPTPYTPPTHAMPVPGPLVYLDDLVEMQAILTARIHALERRIEVLEHRTLWDLLKSQIKSWFKRSPQ